MGTLVNFLIDNYIYVVFVAVLLVLALIGYIVDSKRTLKMKNEVKTEEGDNTSIPIAAINSNITLGDTVNKMAMSTSQSVNAEENKSPLDAGK